MTAQTSSRKMTRNLFLIAILCIPSFAWSQVKVYSGLISKGTDGDTVHFKPNGTTPTAADWAIRMVGIDAPELHLPVTGSAPVGQHPWGDQAAAVMNKLAPVGTQVKLAAFGTDVHGRVLGRVYNGNSDTNFLMVRTGWAVPYMICEGTNCNSSYYQLQQVDAYFAACREARTYKRGIFDPRNPLTEMPFEFRLRMQHRNPDKYVGDYLTKRLWAPKDYSRVDLCQRIFFTNLADANRMGYR